jgi:tRNA1(Val) A37 N6-methylase TrmN6
MSSKKVKDADLAKVKRALLRAAKQARRTAAATLTPLIIYKDGKTVRLAVTKEDTARYDS